MIAVISDLRLGMGRGDSRQPGQEASRRACSDTSSTIRARLQEQLKWIETLAVRCGARHLHLVFAGDTFAVPPNFLNEAESAEWTHPKRAMTAVHAELPLVMRMLEVIQTEHQAVSDMLAKFQQGLPRGRLKAVQVHYLPGFFDQFVNAWPATREWAAGFLGLQPQPRRPYGAALNFAEPGVRIQGLHLRQDSSSAIPVDNPAGDGDADDLVTGSSDRTQKCVDYIRVDRANHLAFAFRANFDAESVEPMALNPPPRLKYAQHGAVVAADRRQVIPFPVGVEKPSAVEQPAKAPLAGEYEVWMADNRFQDEVAQYRRNSFQHAAVSSLREETRTASIPYGLLVFGNRPEMTLLLCFSPTEQASNARDCSLWIESQTAGTKGQAALRIPAHKSARDVASPLDFMQLQLLPEANPPGNDWLRQNEDTKAKPQKAEDLGAYGIMVAHGTLLMERVTNPQGKGGWMLSHWE